MSSLHGNGQSEERARPKVFGIGLSRTGTTSLTHALTLLGYRTLHLPSDDDTRREIAEHYQHQAGPLRLTVLRDHDALTDFVVCCIYQGLDRAYPGSRFILTMRDKESWLDSYERLWQQFLMPLVSGNPDSTEARYLQFLGRMLGEQTIGNAVALTPGFDDASTSFYDRGLFGTFYDAYHEGVHRYFRGREDQLLTLNIVGGEGWEKLAPFLGHPVPEAPFPFEMRLRQGAPHGQNGDASVTRSEIDELRAYLDAFGRHDLESCVRFFADDAVLKFMDKRYQGHRAISEWHQERFKAGVALVDIGEISASDDLVSVDLTVASNVLKRWRVKFRGHAVARFGDDKIEELGLEGGRFLR